MSRPSIDYQRRAMFIPRRLMPPLLAVHSGNCRQPAAIAELQAGGLMATRRLDPLVQSLIDVVTNPELVVSVEVAIQPRRPASPRLATYWRSQRRAVVGHTVGRSDFQLAQVEPELLPFHIAQAVELVPRRHPRFDGSVSIDGELLGGAESALATDPQLFADELDTAGVPEVWVDRIMAAMTLRRSMWTVDAVWLGSGRDESRLCVLDGGFSGYWRLTTASTGRVTIAPSHFDDLMNRIAALLP